MIRLVCIVEIADVDTIDAAQDKLDAFREAVLPELEYGITIYRASEEQADAAYYMADLYAETCTDCGARMDRGDHVGASHCPVWRS